jgi:hypothetical protein
MSDKTKNKYDASAKSVTLDSKKLFSNAGAAILSKYSPQADWKARLFWAKNGNAKEWGWSTDVPSAVKFQVKGAATLAASTVAAVAIFSLF